MNCIPAFTLTSQPESPVDYTIKAVSSTFTTLSAIKFTDSKGCGIVPTFSCMIGGLVCPTWITIDGSNKMSVNTKDSANIGKFTVIIQGTYLSYLGATTPLPQIAWVLNVVNGIPISPIDPCSKTVIGLKDKSIPKTVQVTLTKLDGSPKKFTLPQATDSYSES